MIRITEENPAVLSASLGFLFPAGAVVAVLYEPGDPALLFPAEAALLARAVRKRLQEFAAGRLCARRVLAELGVPNFPLKAAEDRQPLWPPLLVGSITHTAGFCAAVAAARNQVAAVGIDAELVGSVKVEIWPSIFRDEETRWLGSLPESQQAAAATLLFSAKEAFYKCQYPLTGEWLNFHEARVEMLDWGTARGLFRIHASRRIAFADHAALPLQGRFLFHEQFVTVGIAVPASP
jgi:4'-phosphopantetheinyl transferase EntD